jgi:hypothetical protein
VQGWGTLPLEIVAIIFDAVLVDTAHDNDMMKSRTTLRKMAATSSIVFAQVLSVRAKYAQLYRCSEALGCRVLHRMFSNSYLKVRTQPSESSVPNLCGDSVQPTVDFPGHPLAGTWYRQGLTRP